MTETSQEDGSWQSYTILGLGRSGSLSKSSSVSTITSYKMSLVCDGFPSTAHTHLPFALENYLIQKYRKSFKQFYAGNQNGSRYNAEIFQSMAQSSKISNEKCHSNIFLRNNSKVWSIYVIYKTLRLFFYTLRDKLPKKYSSICPYNLFAETIL